MKYIKEWFAGLQRLRWGLAILCVMVIVVSACGMGGQAQLPAHSSAQTSEATLNPPPDANPVLALAPPTSTAATPTATPGVPGVPGAPASPPAGGQPSATPTPTPILDEETQLQQRLFQRINQDRAAAGLSPYTLNSVMSNGARQHSITMSGSCGMQHQCPGEPDPCQRISNEGISWTACGENIGYTSPNPTAWSGVLQVDQAMLNELPPNDGHRQNLLSTSFHRVGVGIFIDARGIIWITEDFAS